MPRRRFSWKYFGSVPAAQLSFKLCLMRENRLDLGESNGLDCCDGEPGSVQGVRLRDGPLLGDSKSMTKGGSSGGVRLKLVPVGVWGWPVRTLRSLIAFLIILSALLSSFCQRLEDFLLELDDWVLAECAGALSDRQNYRMTMIT